VRWAQVDRAKDKFEWGCPDRQLLRQFCLNKVRVHFHSLLASLSPPRPCPAHGATAATTGELLRRSRVPTPTPSPPVGILSERSSRKNSAFLVGGVCRTASRVVKLTQRAYGGVQFNWAQDKVDEILDPVITAWQSRQSQTRIDQFYATQRIAVFKSVRLQNVVAKVSGKRNPVRRRGSPRDTTREDGRCSFVCGSPSVPFSTL
jgi:hypothetical protein